MGVVYLADQLEPVKRRVALKVIRVGMDTREIVARFEAERQALAVMEDSSIAKVLDAGTSDTGLPYFVMEHVDGVPITEYCDHQRLNTRERLNLFITVCEAVQHAHQKGVIHRDLKPSNVLVTEQSGRPVPKVIDFGIAKAIGQRLTDKTLVTEFGQAMGTPAYMSPEQAEASELDVDTRTDVYSLGVMLYQLLVGCLPVDPAELGLMGFVAQLVMRESDPPRPSARVSAVNGEAVRVAALRSADARGLRRELKGDLDWIVMKAMERDRSRRYETANALAMELKRHLANEPVLARPPSTAYRMRKFARRNTVGVAFGATVAVLLVGFTVNQTVQAGRIRRARDLADARRGQAEGLIDFMLGDLRTKLEPIGRLEILNDVGDQALAYFAALSETEFSEAELASRSQALYQVGSVRLNEGSTGEAVAAFSESLRLAKELSARDPTDTDKLFGLSQSHFWVGYAEWLHGDLDAALEEFQAYAAISDRLVATDPENPDWQLELGYAHSNIGSVKEAQGDLEGALEEFRATLGVKQGLADSDPTNPDARLEVAHTHNTIGVVFQKLGELDSALGHFQSDLAIKRALVATDSANAIWSEFLGISLGYLGDLLRVRGDSSGALEQHRAYAGVFERLVAQDRSNTDWTASLATAHRDVAGGLLVRREWGGAESRLRTSRALFEQLLAKDRDRLRFRQGLAATRRVTGRFYLLTGRPDEALLEARAAVALLETEREGDGDDQQAGWWLGESYLLEGAVLDRLRQPEQARASWTRALALTDRSPGASLIPELSDVRARALLRLDRTDEARPIITALRERGYRAPELMELARTKGVLP